MPQQLYRRLLFQEDRPCSTGLGRIAIVGVVAALVRALADGDATNIKFIFHKGSYLRTDGSSAGHYA